MLSSLCEIDPPEVSWQGIEESGERDAVDALLAHGALVDVANDETILCLACDQPHTVAVEYVSAGSYRAYCPDTGYHHVRPEILRRLAVDEDWIVTSIASRLGVRPKRPTDRSASTVRRISRARFGPYVCELFFGRRLADKRRFEEAKRTISSLTGKAPAVLVTTTPHELIPGDPPSRCAIVQLDDVLHISSGEIGVDEAPFVAALRGDGHRFQGRGIGFEFSPGFRAAVVGDQEYSFTDKQALAVEALYEAWRKGIRRLHQTEIQGQADTKQRVGQLFGGHPAYGALIKHDGSSYYWLDL